MYQDLICKTTMNGIGMFFFSEYILTYINNMLQWMAKKEVQNESVLKNEMLPSF